MKVFTSRVERSSSDSVVLCDLYSEITRTGLGVFEMRHEYNCGEWMTVYNLYLFDAPDDGL